MSTTGLITINELVYEMLNDLDNPSKEQFMRYKQFVVRAVTQMNMFVLNTVRVAYLDVSEQNTVNLPSDYIDYSKIAIVVDGRLWTLTVNPDMSMAKYESCGIPIREIYQHNDISDINSLGVIPLAPYNQNGISYDNMHSVGGGWNTTYYRIDKENWRILLDGMVMTPQICLEYISSGISEDGTTFLPLSAKEAILAYAHFLRVDNDDNYPANEKIRKEKRKNDEIKMLVSMERGITFSEMMDAIYRGHKRGVKK